MSPGQRMLEWILLVWKLSCLCAFISPLSLSYFPRLHPLLSPLDPLLHSQFSDPLTTGLPSALCLGKAYLDRLTLPVGSGLWSALSCPRLSSPHRVLSPNFSYSSLRITIPPSLCLVLPEKKIRYNKRHI